MEIPADIAIVESAALAAERAHFDPSAAAWGEMPAEPADAPTSLRQISLDVPVNAVYTASPEDWRDQVFYSVIIDRFERAVPFTAWGDPRDGRTRHGGNLRGLIRRLDYIKELGATTILINPVVMNPPAGYHQYWGVHLMAVDPHIGTMSDLKELVSRAHQMGLRIVLDMVFNHTAPVVECEEGLPFGPRKTVKAWRYPLKPVELAKAECFSLRGDIGDWHDAEQVRVGDLPGGINRFDTDRREVQDCLLKIAKWWIKETDVDGIRLDVYKHVSPAFWDRFFPEIRSYARKLGKWNFLLMGELYDGNPSNLAPELREGKLGSAYNYPSYYWNKDALRGEAPTNSLEANFVILNTILGERLEFLAHFIDNHDLPRFLKAEDPGGVLRFALAHTILTVGVPYLYYGDERGFRQVPGREWLDLETSRDDMFSGGLFGQPGPEENHFSTDSPTFQFVRALIEQRKSRPALRRGKQYVRLSDPNGPGIYAFSRILDDEEVVVALNSASYERRGEMWVDRELSPVGTFLIDALQPAYSVPIQHAQGLGSKISVSIPPYGVRILCHVKPGAA